MPTPISPCTTFLSWCTATVNLFVMYHVFEKLEEILADSFNHYCNVLALALANGPWTFERYLFTGMHQGGRKLWRPDDFVWWVMDSHPILCHWDFPFASHGHGVYLYLSLARTIHLISVAASKILDRECLEITNHNLCTPGHLWRSRCLGIWESQSILNPWISKINDCSSSKLVFVGQESTTEFLPGPSFWGKSILRHLAHCDLYRQKLENAGCKNDQKIQRFFVFKQPLSSRFVWKACAFGPCGFGADSGTRS